MKRISILFALLLTFGCFVGSVSAQTGAITVASTTNEWTSDSLVAGSTHVISIRLNNNTGANAVGINNGFRIYSPDGANYGAISGVRLPVLTGPANFDAIYATNCFSCDGLVSDSISFAGARIFQPGMPAGFNAVAWTVTFSSLIADAGKHICIDSTFTLPGGVWKWVASGDKFPTWSGQHCWTIFEVPDLPPTITNCPVNVTGSHCGTLTFDFNGQDAEASPFTFEKVSGPGSINASNGVWSWNTATLGDVGASITLVVAARDGVTNTLGPSCTVNVVVTNAGPSIVDGCGTTTTITTGDTKNVDLDATDDCDPLTWAIVNDGGAIGASSISPAGTVSYTPDVADAALSQPVVFTIEVCDGLLCDTCTISWTVLAGAPYTLTIEKVHDQLQGEFTDVDITLGSIDVNEGLGGFDLLIAYDNSALSFYSASPGAIYAQCGWEFFDYRFGANGNCHGGCPSGLVRVIGLAETNNGANHPTCNTPKYVGALPTTLASLRFLVTNDRTLECMYVPIRFFWVDCTDNTLSNWNGSKLYISSKVYDYDNADPISGADDFPTYLGAQDECLTIKKDTVSRNIDFQNGGVDIVCADSIDARGDINLNDLAYEIGDAVMFTRYFISGLGAFLGHADGSIAASDVNADGIPLSVADLVYLIGVIVGDKAPFPKTSSEVVNYSFENGKLSVDGEIGAAFVVVKGNATPTLVAGQEMDYAFDGTNTRILVYPTIVAHTGGVPSFTGNFLNVTGSTEIVSVELATAAGSPVVGKALPTTFSLEQNYPNPFNPKTLVRFNLPVAGEYSLTFYNVTGQVVTTVNGTANAGQFEYEWDASNLASGVYFYKLDVKGQYSETKKAVLLK